MPWNWLCACFLSHSLTSLSCQTDWWYNHNSSAIVPLWFQLCYNVQVHGLSTRRTTANYIGYNLILTLKFNVRLFPDIYLEIMQLSADTYQTNTIQMLTKKKYSVLVCVPSSSLILVCSLVRLLIICCVKNFLPLHAFNVRMCQQLVGRKNKIKIRIDASGKFRIENNQLIIQLCLFTNSFYSFASQAVHKTWNDIKWIIDSYSEFVSYNSTTTTTAITTKWREKKTF